MQNFISLLFITLFAAASVAGQGVSVTAHAIKVETVSGSCRTGQVRVRTDGTFQTCQSGTWGTVGSGGGTWGSITGTLSSQTDLQTALNLKANLASPTFTGTVALPSATLAGTLTLTNNSGTIAALGRQGATNPAFSVVSADGAAATGVSITSAAAGSGVTLTAISSGTNEALNLSGKGTGGVNVGAGTAANPALRLGSTSSGIYSAGGALVSFSVNGAETFRMSTGAINYSFAHLYVGDTYSLALGTSPTVAFTTSGGGVARVSNFGTGSGILLVGPSTASATGSFTVLPDNAATNSVVDVARIGVNSTGTAAAGLGARLSFSGETTTTNDQAMAAITGLWTTATHASRTGELVFSTVSNAGSLTERARVTDLGLLLAPVTFANLGTPSNGTLTFCSDCTIANPCASGGTGALAKRLNSVWVCN